MRLAELAAVSARVQAAPGRNDKIERLHEWLRRLPPHEIALGVHYLSGSLSQGRIGVGGALLAALASLEQGAGAQPPLSLSEVNEAFEEVARATGAGAAGRRRARLEALFCRATAPERAFLLRLLAGELRQGALEGVMQDAVARAAAVSALEIRRALMVAGDLGVVAHAALTEGEAGLARFRLQLLQPLQPMLAQTAADVDDALRRLGEAAFEYKLDGVRVQAHKANGEARCYTRSLKDITAAVPELVEAVQVLPAQRLILDGEAVVVTAAGDAVPFQETMRRLGRRQQVDNARAAAPVASFFFDCLHYEGADLIALPARERWRVLDEAVPAGQRIPRRITADPAVARAFLAEALARGHEGLVAKALDAPYEAGRRGSAWLKLKPARTLDLVVLAAEWGHGRRRGRLSNLHLGARDEGSGEYVMLGKTFKGMTDRMLAWQTERLRALAMHEEAGTVYVRPALVVEIAFDGIQASSQYPGGLALRFARVKRYREDKAPEEADTYAAVQALYRQQQRGP